MAIPHASPLTGSTGDKRIQQILWLSMVWAPPSDHGSSCPPLSQSLAKRGPLAIVAVMVRHSYRGSNRNVCSSPFARARPMRQEPTPSKFHGCRSCEVIGRRAKHLTQRRKDARPLCTVSTGDRDRIAFPLVMDVQKSGCGIEIPQTRLHPDAVIQSQVGAENRVNHQVDEAAAGNSAPIVQIGLLEGALERPAIFRRENGFDKVSLPERALVGRLRQAFDPGRHLAEGSIL